jgi:DNA-binding NarL/FixJ family response regulator
LHGRHPEIPVVFLTIHDDEQTLGRAAAAHGAAFVSKQKSVDTLLAAIRCVAARTKNSRGHSMARLP